ncbi:MAG: HD domain-containing protein [Deltaproteobacteria bacterium]|nr:HD domain-containing protein [Deltaproteobacteria bacterium]
MQQKDKDYIIRLFPAIKKISDRRIRDKVVRTWYNAWKRSNFPRIEDLHQFEPARDCIEYSNRDHTNQVCRAAEKMGAMLADSSGLEVRMDYLLAGAVLHDVDKIVIFDAKTGGLTDTGRRFAHAVMGAAMALMEGLPEEVAHIIGAHSTKFSPVPPASIEAIILRHADQVVAQAVYLAKGLDMDLVLRQSLARIT